MPAAAAAAAAAVAGHRGPPRRQAWSARSRAPLPRAAVFLLLATVTALAAAAPADDPDAESPELEDDSTNEVLSREYLMKRAQNLGQRNCPSLGKKFGRYWLRSADSTIRRLEFILANNKWQREALQRQIKRQIPILPFDVDWRPIKN